MSDVIQLLPDSVANQIAAGEVIQRPASVIKELVENAIDAGASNIKILVCDAGKASIQVIDDGCGMSDTDARLSFERHATSKIRKAMDLFSLHTMGFRGEALASIAAVAQVTLQTKRQDDEVGTKIRIEGSRIMEQEVVSCPTGSNFLIENLFFNIPARRKFLKSNATEMNNITQAFERIALVYPEINFSLYNNGQEMLILRTANFHQRILDIFGKRLNQQLLPVEADTTVCTINGYVGKPESAKKKGLHQYFFVNGRFMKHPYFHKAVMSAFDRLLPNGEQVSYFINFTVNPEDIDVNIHPVKTEIKFENEQVIWQILMAAVRDTVGRFSEVSSLDFDSTDKPDIPVFTPGGLANVSAPRIDFNPLYNPFNDPSLNDDGAPSFSDIATQPAGSDDAAYDVSHGRDAASHNSYGTMSSASSHRSAKGWDELFRGVETPHADGGVIKDANLFGGETADGGMSSQLFGGMGDASCDATQADAPLLLGYNEDDSLMQHSGRYVMVSLPNGIAMIDQHRASMRILYEQYMGRFSNSSMVGEESHGKARTQKLLFPEEIHFPASYTGSLEEILEELRTLGFEITPKDGGAYSIDGLPAGLGGLDAVKLVQELVADALEHCTGASEKIYSLLAQGLASRAAVTYGEILDVDAMRTLIRQLSQCASQVYSPDGKKIIRMLFNDDIERMMG